MPIAAFDHMARRWYISNFRPNTRCSYLQLAAWPREGQEIL